ncbi:hypothetical protein ACIA5G_09430 [Amycolatopsis sp. NPDC051758]|uniref:hypothetical protein n=1 Tax=Amycolatopsis sp. NPDC051758 TaxID=3363935 RepID=UPI0037B3BA44
MTGHLLPPELRAAAGNAYAAAVAPVAAEQGEPWHSFLSPAAMAVPLGNAGSSKSSNRPGSSAASIRCGPPRFPRRRTRTFPAEQESAAAEAEQFAVNRAASALRGRPNGRAGPRG